MDASAASSASGVPSAGGRSTPNKSHGAVIMVAIAAALGGFLFGYDTAVINGTVDAIQARVRDLGRPLGFVVSSALLGCAVGAWFAGPLADRFGRVRIMLVAAVLFAVSAIGSALAFAPWDLTIWRVVGGLGVGAASVIAPAYIAEVAPAELRGRLGSLQQLAIVTGIFVSLLVDYLLAASRRRRASSRCPGAATAWRWMFASAAIPARGLRRARAADPGVAALPGTQAADSARPREVLQRGSSAATSTNGSRRSSSRSAPARRSRTCGPARPAVRAAADRLDRHPALGVPAVRRHQRDLLLLVDAVALGRLQRERRAADHRDHRRSPTS